MAQDDDMKFRYIIHKPLIIRLFNNPERGKRNWKRARCYSTAPPNADADADGDADGDDEERKRSS